MSARPIVDPFFPCDAGTNAWLRFPRDLSVFEARFLRIYMVIFFFPQPSRPGRRMFTFSRLRLSLLQDFFLFRNAVGFELGRRLPFSPAGTPLSSRTRIVAFPFRQIAVPLSSPPVFSLPPLAVIFSSIGALTPWPGWSGFFACTCRDSPSR